MRDRRTIQRLIGFLAIATVILAGFNLLTLALDAWNVARIGPSFVPMAPITAGSLILLGFAVLLNYLRPNNRLAIAFAYIAIASTIVISCTVLVNNGANLKEWLLSDIENQDLPVTQMSPLTAIALLLLISPAFLLQLPPLSNRRFSHASATFLAIATLMLCATVMIGYGIRALPFYGSTSVPMAFLTAIGISLLSAGLLIGAASKTWLGGDPTDPPPGRTWSRALTVFLLLCVVIGIPSVFHLQHELRLLRKEAHADLATIADLKVAQITRWHRERLADAESIFNTPAIIAQANQCLAENPPPETQQAFLSWMKMWQQKNHYLRLVLFNAQSVPVLVAGPSLPPNTSILGVDTASRANEVIITDLYRSQATLLKGHIARLNFWIPVGANGTEATTEAHGSLLMQLDPYEFLYPLIQSWPTPSKTAETLIVRKEGDDVVFLNKLRHEQKDALTLRLPIASNPRLPAAMAVEGKHDLAEGVDYRGVPVLAALRKIPGTPWFMVAKVDKGEIYEPLRQQAWVTGGAVASLLLIGTLSASLIWRRRELAAYQRELASERERQTMAKQLAYLSKYANDMIILSSQENQILDANEHAAETYGYTMEELKKLTLQDLRSEQARVNFQMQLGGLSTTRPVLYETVHRRKDGTEFPVEASVRLIEIAGTVVRQSIIRDITERKRAEAELRASEERFRRAVVQSPFPIVLRTADGNVVEVSASWSHITGYTTEELKQGTDSALETLHSVDSRITEGDYSIRTKGGDVRIWEFSSASLGTDSEGRQLIISMALDVTERRKAEEEITQLNTKLEMRVRLRTQELEMANKEMEAFCYSVSHDLRAPLRGIDGWSQALVEDYEEGLDERARGYLRRVRSETQRMGELIDDLLLLSRVSRAEMKREPVNLSALAQTVTNRLRESQPERSATILIQPDLTAIGDPRLLEIALNNLLDNAWKFTGKQPVAHIEFTLSQTNPTPVFQIRDNGAGFDMTYAKNLFGAFQRMHNATEFPGTGIGLATVQRIIRRHGGEIWAESHVEEGATFYFTLNENT